MLFDCRANVVSDTPTGPKPSERMALFVCWNVRGWGNRDFRRGAEYSTRGSSRSRLPSENLSAVEPYCRKPKWRGETAGCVFSSWKSILFPKATEGSHPERKGKVPPAVSSEGA